MALRFPSLTLSMLHPVEVAALLACALFSACQRHLTDANLNCVKMDMSPKEVESILGPPNRQETREMPLQTDVKTLPVQRYFYDQNGKTVVIHFVDGKLIGEEGSFE
jgi:hypothetical protein